MFKKNLMLVALTSAMIIALLGRVIAAHHDIDKPSETSKLAYQTIKSMNMKQAWVDILPDMVDLIPASMFQTMESQGAPAELVKKLENSLKDKIEAFKVEINFEKIGEKVEHDFASVFSEVYTEEELKSMMNFYQSPIGKQIAKKQSRLMKGTIPLQQEAMDEFLPELTSLVMEEVQASF